MFRDKDYVIKDDEVLIVDEFTGRIMPGRRYSDGLHQAIEAKEHVKVKRESKTLATITFQNFFNKFDKKAGMTGTALTEEKEFRGIYNMDVVEVPTNRPVARIDHNDAVFKTMKGKFNAVVEEVVASHEKGQPVLVGTINIDTSELLSDMLKKRGIPHNVLNAKYHELEAEIVAEAGKHGAVTIATNMAGRGTDIKLDDEARAAGGLKIIGTERHESRRIDNQLRGRAGRQGDPGSSQFFVSLEDDLMRLFSSERIIRVMDRLGHQEGDVIQHSMITKSIERAQKKVEENNFGIRKRLLEYDDVMNSQRTVIYKQRRQALLGERIGVAVANNTYDVCEAIVMEYQPVNDPEGFRMEVLRVLSVDYEVDPEEFQKARPNELAESLYRYVREAYQRKVEHIAQQAYPVIKNVFETRGDVFKNIVVPFTDGQRMYSVVTNLEKAYRTNGEDLMRSFEKSVILAHIDDAWKEHLREMDDLKQSVQNAAYEQKDPLLIYKFESYNLFKTMVEKINKGMVSTLMKGQIPMQEPEHVREAEEKRTDLSKLRESRSEAQAAAANREQVRHEPVKVGPKVGRNDPCPCGSGLKYKNCHGKNE